MTWADRVDAVTSFLVWTYAHINTSAETLGNRGVDFLGPLKNTEVSQDKNGRATETKPKKYLPKTGLDCF